MEMITEYLEKWKVLHHDRQPSHQWQPRFQSIRMEECGHSQLACKSRSPSRCLSFHCGLTTAKGQKEKN